MIPEDTRDLQDKARRYESCVRFAQAAGALAIAAAVTYGFFLALEWGLDGVKRMGVIPPDLLTLSAILSGIVLLPVVFACAMAGAIRLFCWMENRP